MADLDSMYQNLFGHAADAEGKAYWEGQLSSGAVNEGNIAQALVNAAQEIDPNKYAGLTAANAYTAPVQTTSTATATPYTAPAASPVAATSTPPTPNIDINARYNDIFGRDADQAGLEYWQGQLANGGITANNFDQALINSAQEIDPTLYAGLVPTTQAGASNLNALTLRYNQQGQDNAAALADQSQSLMDMRSQIDNLQNITAGPPPGSSVEERMLGLLDSDSDWMNNAKTRGAEFAASRGLLNASVGGGFIEQAAQDAALNVAGQDANTAATFGLQDKTFNQSMELQRLQEEATNYRAEMERDMNIAMSENEWSAQDREAFSNAINELSQQYMIQTREIITDTEMSATTKEAELARMASFYKFGMELTASQYGVELQPIDSTSTGYTPPTAEELAATDAANADDTDFDYVNGEYVYGGQTYPTLIAARAARDRDLTLNAGY